MNKDREEVSRALEMYPMFEQTETGIRFKGIYKKLFPGDLYMYVYGFNVVGVIQLDRKNASNQTFLMLLECDKISGSLLIKSEIRLENDLCVALYDYLETIKCFSDEVGYYPSYDKTSILRKHTINEIITDNGII